MTQRERDEMHAEVERLKTELAQRPRFEVTRKEWERMWPAFEGHQQSEAVRVHLNRILAQRTAPEQSRAWTREMAREYMNAIVDPNDGMVRSLDAAYQEGLRIFGAIAPVAPEQPPKAEAAAPEHPMRTFEEAFAETGYQYGRDALEQVRLGWDLALAKRPAPKQPRAWKPGDDAHVAFWAAVDAYVATWRHESYTGVDRQKAVVGVEQALRALAPVAPEQPPKAEVRLPTREEIRQRLYEAHRSGMAAQGSAQSRLRPWSQVKQSPDFMAAMDREARYVLSLLRQHSRADQAPVREHDPEGACADREALRVELDRVKARLAVANRITENEWAHAQEIAGMGVSRPIPVTLHALNEALEMCRSDNVSSENEMSAEGFDVKRSKSDALAADVERIKAVLCSALGLFFSLRQRNGEPVECNRKALSAALAKLASTDGEAKP